MKAIDLFLVTIMTVTISCQSIDESKEVEAIKNVIIAEGEARQNHDIEMLYECWAHEPYVTNYAAINWGCHTPKGWDELSEAFKKDHQGEPNPDINIRRENINTHINGNMAIADFDLFIDNVQGANLESKANATLEKINGSWKIVYLNVIFDKSFEKNKTE